MAERSRFRLWQAAAFFGGISILSAVSASKTTRAYWRGLRTVQPRPPAWLFPPVWAGLNLVRLWADIRVLNDDASPDRDTILGLRAVSWALQAIAAPAVLRARRPSTIETLALAEGATAGAAIALLARRDPLAAAALAPLTLWTGYTSLAAGREGAGQGGDALVDRLRWGGAI